MICLGLSLLIPQDGRTALMVAAQEGYLEIVVLLLDCGIDINAGDKVIKMLIRTLLALQ